MGLETGSFISALVSTNPVGATDPKSQGDDHIRFIKAKILETFPNVTGAVTSSHTELNLVAGATGGLATLSVSFAALSSSAFLKSGGTITGTMVVAGPLFMSGKSIFDANASVAAHATTMDPWSLGNYVTLTGTAVTFTNMAAAPQAGAEVELYMNTAHVFTDGAVFEVDGNANFTATAGDRVLIRAKSTSVFTVHPIKADGTSVVSISNNFVQSVFSQSGAVATTSTAIPYDDTIPQVTEGGQAFSVDITPTNAANKLMVKSVLYLSTNTDAHIIVALFKDGASNAVAAAHHNIESTSAIHAVTLMYEVAAGGTSQITFSLRYGAPSGTTTLNGLAGSRVLGGVLNSYIEVIEVAA